MPRTFQHSAFAISKAASEVKESCVERGGIFIDPAFVDSVVPSDWLRS